MFSKIRIIALILTVAVFSLSSFANEIDGLREQREETRFKISLSTNVDNLIYDGMSYGLHSPLTIHIINISKKGMRFRASHNAFISGNIFQIHLRIGDNDTLLMVEVLNISESHPDYSEFGCRFVTKAGDTFE